MRASFIAMVTVLLGVSSVSAQVLDCEANEQAILEACNVHQGGGEQIFTKIDHIVCINDFQYMPAMLQAEVGDTVAWVNVEACGDMAVEGAVVPQTGCDPTHEVVTTPAQPEVTGDTVNFQNICSPNPGIVGPGAENPPQGCGEDETNVRCHTFATSGVQHYTCFTNGAHTALMHGGIVVDEGGS